MIPLPPGLVPEVPLGMAYRHAEGDKAARHLSEMIMEQQQSNAENEALMLLCTVPGSLFALQHHMCQGYSQQLLILPSSHQTRHRHLSSVYTCARSQVTMNLAQHSVYLSVRPIEPYQQQRYTGAGSKKQCKNIAQHKGTAQTFVRSFIA